MLKDITIGQYYPGNSVIHRLDPRSKLLFTMAYIILIFFVKNIGGYLAAFLFLAGFVVLSEIPFKLILKGLKPILFLIMFTVVINMFLTPGNVIFKVWFLKITDAGVLLAVQSAVRLTMLVAATSVMTLSTSPIALTDGMEHLMKKIPLVKRFAHEMAMMMSIALRFIPTLMDETDRIIKSQKSRGADFESGNLLNRAKSLVPILIPLFISAFQRADELALAMEARCYRGGDNRTKMKQLHYEKNDYLAYMFILIMAVLFIGSRYIPF